VDTQPRGERPSDLVIDDPKPVAAGGDIWRPLSQIAVVGIFVLALGAFLYLGRAIILPILSAMVIGVTLSPLVRRGGRIGLTPALSALVLVLALTAIAAVGVTLLSGPISEWIERAPDIVANIKQKLYVLDQPLSAWHTLQQALTPAGANIVKVEPGQVEVVAPVVAFLTPAVAQMVVFFGTLIFYMIYQHDVRRRLVMLFPDREAKLRALRVFNDIERNLTDYIGVFTLINILLGVVVTLGAWLFGFSNPVIFGAMAAMLNYLPYIGPATMTFILFGVGLVTFPSLGQAIAPPLCYIALTTIEGQFITPAIMGRRLTLNPLLVFLSLAFWTWLWGPVGSFLAVPLSIIMLVVFNHLFPHDEQVAKLPD